MLRYLVLFFLIFATLTTLATARNPYYKIKGEECGEFHLNAATGLCPAWVIVLFGRVQPGACAEQGFDVYERKQEIAMGPCGRTDVLVFRSRGQRSDGGELGSGFVQGRVALGLVRAVSEFGKTRWAIGREVCKSVGVGTVPLAL